MTDDEVTDYVESVRTGKPVRSAFGEVKRLMFDHIAECRLCQIKARAERNLQDWLDQLEM
ncbi:MAG: hypothetical protein WDN47_02850 [Candidatus Doudnabacteria bacterium]